MRAIGTGAELRGYKIRTTSPEQVTISLALHREDGALGQVPVTVVRTDGDWKILLPPDGRIGTVGNDEHRAY